MDGDAPVASEASALCEVVCRCTPLRGGISLVETGSGLESSAGGVKCGVFRCLG